VGPYFGNLRGWVIGAVTSPCYLIEISRKDKFTIIYLDNQSLLLHTRYGLQFFVVSCRFAAPNYSLSHDASAYHNMLFPLPPCLIKFFEYPRHPPASLHFRISKNCEGSHWLKY